MHLLQAHSCVHTLGGPVAAFPQRCACSSVGPLVRLTHLHHYHPSGPTAMLPFRAFTVHGPSHMFTLSVGPPLNYHSGLHAAPQAHSYVSPPHPHHLSEPAAMFPFGTFTVCRPTHMLILLVGPPLHSHSGVHAALWACSCISFPYPHHPSGPTAMFPFGTFTVCRPTRMFTLSVGLPLHSHSGVHAAPWACLYV